MYLRYVKYKISLNLERVISFNTYPSFIFHSVLGKELKRLTCLFKNRECSDCSIKNTCPYSVFFVTPIEKDNQALKGRDKAPHPYIISTDIQSHQKVDKVILTLTIFGDAIKMFPYLFYSLLKAGEKGIFKDRIKYYISSVNVREKEILKDDGNLNMDFDFDSWEINNNNKRQSYSLNIYFISPLRLKYKGKFLSDITFNDIVYAASRRVNMLTDFYGVNKSNANWPDLEINYSANITAKNLKWVDYSYYSSRQKRSLKLGGLVGKIQVEGSFDDNILSLLNAAELFHIGKNPSFGVGKVRVEKINR